jgi:glucosyl-3-phosphoglycerate synthase
MGEAKAASGKLEAERPKSKVVVIFPAVNEEKTIGSCIAAAKQSKYHPEIIVVDGHSTDNTVEEAKKAGAKVIFPERRIHPGKGLAMKTGLEVAFKKDADIIVFMDSDIENLSPEWVDRLVNCVDVEAYDMCRGAYFREPTDAPVTKLVAKRLLSIFFPEIAHLDQPLTGEVAAKTPVWKTIYETCLPDGWGIDVVILIETAMKGFRIKETWLGFKHHRSYRAYREDVGKLWKMSEQVAAAILQKAKKYGRIDNIDSVST